MQPTLPDEHHRRAPWQAPAEHRGWRTFAGGAALGGLLGVASLQLSNILREPEAAAAGEPAGPHVAVAWLAEKPTHRAPEPPPSSTNGSSRKPSRAPASATAERARSAPPPDAPVKPDPSAEGQELAP
jgi:hypothetical protein